MMMETLPWPSRGVRPRTTPPQEWVKILMGGERTAQHTRKKTREILGDSGVHGGRVWRRFPPPGVLHPTGHPRGASPPAELVQGGGRSH